MGKTRAAAKAKTTPGKKDQVEKSDDSQEEVLNGDTENVEEEVAESAGDDESEEYKIELKGLPKYTLAELKKLLTDGLSLEDYTIVSPKRASPWVYVLFETKEHMEKGLKVLNGYTWKTKTLTAEAVEEDKKRKREDSDEEKEEDGDKKGKEEEPVKPAEPAADQNKRKQEVPAPTQEVKKAKVELTLDDKVKNAITPYWNMSYDDQIKKKTNEAKSILRFLSKVLVQTNSKLAGWVEQQREKHENMACEMDEMKRSPVVDGYCNKCEFKIGLNPETQERMVGFLLANVKEGSIGIGPANSLRHLPDRMKEAVKAFQQYVRESDKAPFAMNTRTGHWRLFVVRVTKAGDLMAVVVIHPQSLTEEKITELKEDVKDYFLNRGGKECNVTSLYFQTLPDEKAHEKPPPQLLFGKERLEESVMDVDLLISPLSGWQVNTAGEDVLYSAIVEMTDLNEETTVLAFCCCGTGDIALCLARKCEKVYGIGAIVQANIDGELNAKENDIENVEFISGSSDEVLPSITEKVKSKNVVVFLDPPSTGLSQKTMAEFSKLEKLNKIIFISSNPRAAGKNLNELSRCLAKAPGNPFVPTKAVAVDIFPHTTHFQLVVCFERVEESTLPKAKAVTPAVVKKPLLRGRGRGRAPLRGAIRGRGFGPIPRGGAFPLPRGRGFPRGFRGARGGYDAESRLNGWAPRPLMGIDIVPRRRPPPPPEIDFGFQDDFGSQAFSGQQEYLRPAFRAPRPAPLPRRSEYASDYGTQEEPAVVPRRPPFRPRLYGSAGESFRDTYDSYSQGSGNYEDDTMDWSQSDFSNENSYGYYPGRQASSTEWGGDGLGSERPRALSYTPERPRPLGYGVERPALPREPLAYREPLPPPRMRRLEAPASSFSGGLPPLRAEASPYATPGRGFGATRPKRAFRGYRPW